MLMSTARRCGSILAAKIPRSEQCLDAAVGTVRTVSTWPVVVFSGSYGFLPRARQTAHRGRDVRLASTYKSRASADAQGSDSSTTRKGGSYSPLPLAYVSYERREASASDQPSKTPLVIHHSLFGCKENWKKIAKEVNSISKRSVFALDARNHGESPHSNEMSLALMAKDVLHFTKRLEMEKASFMGHNFGGMIGMMVALMYPQILSKLVVVDAAPQTLHDNALRHSLILKATAVLKNMEPELRRCPGYSRMSTASKAIEPILRDKRDIAVVLSNLVLSGDYLPPERPKESTTDGVKSDPNSIWRVNLDSVLSNPCLMDFPEFDEPVAFGGPALFIQGKNSQCVRLEDEAKIRKLFPNAEFVWLGDCGHWIHLEKHEEFLQHVLQFLERKAAA